MKFVQAFIVLGLFFWLGYAVLTDTVPGGDGGSSKTRFLKSATNAAIEQFGTDITAYGLFGLGLLLALFFVTRRSSE